MAGLLDLLNSDLGKTLISGTSQQFGQDEGKTANALEAALPLILGAMKNNASSPEGASGLLSALGNDKHGGGILDNLENVLGGSGVDEDVLTDGAGILGHVFAGKEQNVANAVSKSSGIDLASAMSILKVAGPLVMGYLGKQSRQDNVSDAGGVDNMLGGLLGGGGQQEQNLVSQLLDADGDGSVIDDLMGMATGSKKGGLGSLLGGMFNS